MSHNLYHSKNKDNEVIPQGSQNTLIQNTTTKYDFYTSPQPTSYVPKPKKKKASGGAAAPALEENPAAEPIEEPMMPPRSISPALNTSYEWEE